MRFDGKTTRRRLKKLRLDEISLVDMPAHGPNAGVAIMKRALPEPAEKRMALTTPAAGHSHSIIMVQGSNEGLVEVRAGQTSYGSADGMQGHVHDWIRDDAGNIIIAEAAGHTHGVGALVMKGDLEELEKATFTAEQRRQLAESGEAMPDGSFPIRNRSDLKNAIQAFGRAKNKAAAAKHIRARAKALGLTDLLPESGALADQTRKGDTPASENLAAEGGTETIEMTPEELAAIEKAANEKLATEKARADRAEAIVSLSPEQRAHFDGLSVEKQGEFLAAEDKDAIVKAATESDPVVYESLDGDVFRKSDDPRLVKAARRADAAEKRVMEAEAVAKRAELRKRAGEELSHVTGDLDAKADLLGAVATLPVEKQGPVLAILKSKDAGMQKAFETVGTSDDGNGNGADVDSRLDAIAKSIREKQPTLTPEQAYVKALETPEGAELANRRIR